MIDEHENVSEEDLKTSLLAQILLRLNALEQVLMDKNIIPEKDLANALTANMLKFEKHVKELNK